MNQGSFDAAPSDASDDEATPPDADSPLVSIVVPTKNRRKRLARTLTFFAEQTYQNFEVVVSDDGSDDDTSAAVGAFGDPRFRVVRAETSTGVSGARNRGIAAADGAYVAFCDDDDLWLPTKIERQVAALHASPASGRTPAWVTCGAVHTTDELRPVHSSKFPTPAKIDAEIAHVNPIPGGCSSVLVERAALDAVGGFDPGLSMFADWDMWLRLYVAHGLPAIVDEYLLLYLVHDGQMTRKMAALTSELDVFRSKHAEARATLPRPRVDGVDWWVVQSLRAGGRWTDAAKYVLTGASSRSPLALRELRRPLFKRHGPPQPFKAETPEQLREEALVQAACADARRIVTANPATTTL